jgi:cobalt-zinc-cadmium efflux system outer membrane protein
MPGWAGRAAFLALCIATSATAQNVGNLGQAFESAWARQPEARAASLRQDAATAGLDSSSRWFAEPPSLELSLKTDQLNQDRGSREYEAGVALPLWLPGERAGTRALAETETLVLDARLAAARLHTAGALRDAWWGQAQARIDLSVAKTRLLNIERLAADVARRVKAGDLARADGHQADAAVAAARAEVARAKGAVAEAGRPLRALLGATVVDLTETPEPMPLQETAAAESSHPALRELAELAEASRRARQLASLQTRANPELRLAATRDRATAGDAWDQTLTMGVRIPFGVASNNRARVATASAEVVEAETRLEQVRLRVRGEIEAARERLESTHAQLAAAEERARLAAESRGFFEKSFRLGETDLPTRLRVELEALDAQHQTARARLEAAAAVSALRQALGLLPEQQ